MPDWAIPSTSHTIRPMFPKSAPRTPRRHWNPRNLASAFSVGLRWGVSIGMLLLATAAPASPQPPGIARDPASFTLLLRILRALAPTSLNEGEERELRELAAEHIAWGDDAPANQWRLDGQCDDGRFGNAPEVRGAVGGHSKVGEDATDCRKLFLAGKIEILRTPRN